MSMPERGSIPPNERNSNSCTLFAAINLKEIAFYTFVTISGWRAKTISEKGIEGVQAMSIPPRDINQLGGNMSR